MTIDPLTACLCALALVSALVGGVFQSFSDFVMRGLGGAEGDAGMLAMQQINVTVMRSLFLTSFFLLVPGLAAAVWAASNQSSALFHWVLGAAIVYFVGVVLVTVLGNVPMNNRLDQLISEGEREDTAEYWQLYLVRWTRWNHLRTLASAATAFLLLAAVLMQR
ncbi:MAG: anthrone oxygenase family protein [Pseudomonadota bacterium]